MKGSGGLGFVVSSGTMVAIAVVLIALLATVVWNLVP
jgi:hypothetical protein